MFITVKRLYLVSFLEVFDCSLEAKFQYHDILAIVQAEVTRGLFHNTCLLLLSFYVTKYIFFVLGTYFVALASAVKLSIPFSRRSIVWSVQVHFVNIIEIFTMSATNDNVIIIAFK